MIAPATPPSAGTGSVPDPIPNPFEDADALADLEHEISVLSAHIQAATHRLLLMIADFDRRRGWEIGGHRTCAHWLHMRTGIDLGAARERVRTARALVDLPRISETMSRGELSYSAVRALTRVATPEDEEELLEVARESTTAELERFVRAWRTMGAKDEATLERENWRRRRFSVFPDDRGMYVVKGRVPPEVGALLMRAIEAASDALYREETRAGTGGRGDARAETTAKQRRADALGLLCERAMQAGFGGERVSAETSEEAPDEGEVPDEAEVPPKDVVPISGTRAERYQVMLHVGDGGTRLEDGTRISAETSKRLACDAAVVRIERGAPNQTGRRPVLDVGRRTRTVPSAMRRALEVRDRGCRWPGCGLRFTDAHHLRHWADGGETSLDNLVLLCRFHHRKVHEEGWKVERWGKRRHLMIIDPRGDVRLGRAVPGESGASGESGESGGSGERASRPEGSADTLVRDNLERGIDPDPWGIKAAFGVRESRAVWRRDDGHDWRSIEASIPKLFVALP